MVGHHVGWSRVRDLYGRSFHYEWRCSCGMHDSAKTARERDEGIAAHMARQHDEMATISDEARQEAIADGSDCGCPAFHHSCGIVSPDLRTDPRIHCAECGMPADEDGYCTAVDCPRCGKTARG